MEEWMTDAGNEDKGHRIAAIVGVGGILIAIMFVRALAIATWTKPPEEARARLACQDNQARVDTVVKQYLRDRPAAAPSNIEWSVLVEAGNYLRATPQCPADGRAYELLPLDRETTAPLVRCGRIDHPFPK